MALGEAKRPVVIRKARFSRYMAADGADCYTKHVQIAGKSHHMKLVFSSKEYPTAKRFDAWRAGVCEHYVQVDMVDTGPGDYVGYIKEASFGPVTLTETQSPPLHIVRRRSHLSRVSEDCIYVCFPAKSGQAVEQRNQNILYTVGKAGLFTASEPYELKNTQTALFIYLEFPREKFLKRFSGHAPPVTSLIQTKFGIGRVAAAMCSSMVMEAENLQADARSQLGEDILNILALAFETTEHDVSEFFGRRRSSRRSPTSGHVLHREELGQPVAQSGPHCQSQPDVGEVAAIPVQVGRHVGIRLYLDEPPGALPKGA